ncbi:MAG: zinc ribbon domain-containing protein, partial [Firmicutes bacterium]|nr:zinc ribbon domain-containing protein [Bacillota bacterium]
VPKVQELIASRRRKRRNGTTQIFAGLIKCADCGWSLAYGENKQNKNPYGYYHCSKNGHAAQIEILEAVRKTNKRIVSAQAKIRATAQVKTN